LDLSFEAAIAMMWDDAVMQPPGAPQVEGHAAIRALYGAVEFISLDAGPLDVRASGDLAAVWGPLSYTFTMAGDTMAPEPSS
jgi:ketosteroid isomerase-like protein